MCKLVTNQDNINKSIDFTLEATIRPPSLALYMTELENLMHFFL